MESGTRQKHVGLSEIAEKVGRPKQTVLHWTRRSDFPEPASKMKMGPAWDHDEIDEWLKSQKEQPGGLLAPPE